MAKNSALTKIIAEAKKLRKAKPGMEWKSAVKAAGAKYRAGSIKAAPKKKAVVKKKIAVKKVIRKKISGIKMQPKVHGSAVITSAIRSRDIIEKDINVMNDHLVKWQTGFYPANTKSARTKKIAYIKRHIVNLKRSLVQQNQLIKALL